MKCNVVCGNWPKERGVSVSPTTLTFLPWLPQCALASLNAAALILPSEAAGPLSSREIMKVSFPVGTMPVVEAQPASTAQKTKNLFKVPPKINILFVSSS